MAGVKTKFRNRLGCTKVNTYLQISEGVALADSDAAINISHNKNIHLINTTPHKYPKNRKQNKPGKVLDVVMITFSELEDSEEEILWDELLLLCYILIISWTLSVNLNMAFSVLVTWNF